MAKRLLEILLEENLIDRMQQQTILYRQRLYGGKVGSHILALGYLNEKQLSHALSIHYGIPEIDPHVLDTIDRKLILDFPINLAKKYIALPLMKIKKTLSIVISDPSDQAALKKIQSEIGMEIKTYVAPEQLIKKYIIKYYNLPPSFLLTSDIGPKEEKSEKTVEELGFVYSDEMESFAPKNEVVMDLNMSGKKKAMPLQKIKKDSQVFDLLSVKNFNEYAEKIANLLFLGLNKLILFEINNSEIRPITAKGWRMMQGEKDGLFYKTQQEDINYYIMLQENFYCGPITDIVSEKLASYLVEKPAVQLEKYHAMFLTLSIGNKVYFLIYGDFNGDKIPEQYQRKWKELLPKLLDTTQFLMQSE